MPDPDLEIGRGGGGEGSSRPLDKGERGGLKKNFGPSGLKGAWQGCALSRIELKEIWGAQLLLVSFHKTKLPSCPKENLGD